jgi:hypothetical protein
MNEIKSCLEEHDNIIKEYFIVTKKEIYTNFSNKKKNVFFNTKEKKYIYYASFLDFNDRKMFHQMTNNIFIEISGRFCKKSRITLIPNMTISVNFNAADMVDNVFGSISSNCNNINKMIHYLPSSIKKICIRDRSELFKKQNINNFPNKVNIFCVDMNFEISKIQKIPQNIMLLIKSHSNNENKKNDKIKKFIDKIILIKTKKTLVEYYCNGGRHGESINSKLSCYICSHRVFRYLTISVLDDIITIYNSFETSSCDHECIKKLTKHIKIFCKENKNNDDMITKLCKIIYINQNR